MNNKIPKIIVIAGGSGFIGSRLAERFIKAEDKVIILDLIPPRQSEDAQFIKADLTKNEVPTEVTTADVVINLTGANIFNRWTNEYKKLIYDSRILTTRKLVDFFAKNDTKPSVFVCASAVGFYGDRKDELLDESQACGTDFLAHVCNDWEVEAKKAEKLGIRVVSIRTGIVLDVGGGMLNKLIPLFKLGVGGPMGNGKQWFSWIAMSDLLRIYEMAVNNPNLVGPVNAVAPTPARNKEMAQTLARTLHRPAIVPLPGFILRAIVGEFASAILASQRVVPTKLQAINFHYEIPNIEQAFKK